MVNHPNRKPARYRIKATFTTSTGKPFVRYWRNNDGCIGWIFPEVKETANPTPRVRLVGF